MLECEERGLMLHEAKVGSEEECNAGNGNTKTSFLVLNVMYIQMFSKTLITEALLGINSDKRHGLELAT